MRRDFAEVARQWITSALDVGGAASFAAKRAEHACNVLARHLARLLGETGVETLFKRSMLQASAEFSWLVTAPTSPSVSSMRAAMEQQPPEAIVEAFVAIIAAFVALLERLIGKGLVDRLLAEVWNGVFTDEAKDIP